MNSSEQHLEYSISPERSWGYYVPDDAQITNTSVKCYIHKDEITKATHLVFKMLIS